MAACVLRSCGPSARRVSLARRPICALATTQTRCTSTFQFKHSSEYPKLKRPVEATRIVAGLVLERSILLTQEIEPWQQAYEDIEWDRNEDLVEVPKEMQEAAYQAIRDDPEAEEVIDDTPMPKLMPRRTKADEENDRRSVDRRLDCRLYLLVKKPRGQHAWQFPQGGWMAGESLRQTVEREFVEECGTKVEHHILGNAPIGHYQYDFPQPIASDGQTHEAATVFLFHSLYLRGPVVPDGKEIVDYVWVTKDEMPEYIESPELLELTTRMLMDDRYNTDPPSPEHNFTIEEIEANPSIVFPPSHDVALPPGKKKPHRIAKFLERHTKKLRKLERKGRSSAP